MRGRKWYVLTRCRRGFWRAGRERWRGCGIGWVRRDGSACYVWLGAGFGGVEVSLLGGDCLGFWIGS